MSEASRRAATPQQKAEVDVARACTVVRRLGFDPDSAAGLAMVRIVDTAIARVVERERERCASLAESMDNGSASVSGGEGIRIARAIRRAALRAGAPAATKVRRRRE